MPKLKKFEEYTSGEVVVVIGFAALFVVVVFGMLGFFLYVAAWLIGAGAHAGWGV
jgi:hypothetical protein